MAVELRPMTAVLVLFVVLATGSISSLVITEAAGDEYDAPADSITLDGDDYQLWLYTSRERSFDQRTLPINMVVYGDTDQVQRRLLEGERGDWDETGDEEQEIAPAERSGVVNGTSVEWEIAHGSLRYAFIEGSHGERIWLSEAYQVHDGDYLGSRHHIRAYTSPDGRAEWTAMQAHHEHWDWFNTRHVVTSVDDSQTYLEQEFIDESGGPEIFRVPVGGDDRVDFERWLTIVDFRSQSSLPASVLFVLVIRGTIKRRSDIATALAGWYLNRDVRAVMVATSIVAVFMFVRLTGIGLERAFDVPPRRIAVLLYPIIFSGFPICAYLLARQLDRARAFSGASIGFVAAVLTDYTYLGVTHIPLDVLVHRGGLAVALGLIAIGSSRPERRDPDRVSHVRVGVLLWLVGTILPLLRHSPLPV